MVSDVFFMNDRGNSLGESIKYKAVKVFRDAGLGELFKPGDTVGVKIHFGEHGLSHHLRSSWVRSIIEEIQRLGGKPVVVDCTTIVFSTYSSRATREGMLCTAARHGMTEETFGCPIWICDGEIGEDDVKVDIPSGTYLKYSYMGKKLLDLDAMIAVTHFKGHPLGVFGGALKNIGIGCGSKRGKALTHLFSHERLGLHAVGVNQAAAKAAWAQPHPNTVDNMIEGCPWDCFSWENDTLNFDRAKCRDCTGCFGSGLFSGILAPNPETMLYWASTIPDAFSGYVRAIGMDKVGYVSYAMDITPWCDCCNWSDRAVVPNLGVFASRDPVAIDMACLEMSEAVLATPGSKADELGFGEPGTERFTHTSGMAGVSQWVAINSGIHNGVGTSEYNLILSDPVANDSEFFMKPYAPCNVWGKVHREAMRGLDWNVGRFFHDDLQMSMVEMSLKPKGKVADEA
jgi:uncharacterized Fe-S center protein